MKHSDIIYDFLGRKFHTDSAIKTGEDWNKIWSTGGLICAGLGGVLECENRITDLHVWDVKKFFVQKQMLDFCCVSLS